MMEADQMGKENVSEIVKEEVVNDGTSSVGELESHSRLSLETETGLATCRVCQCVESDKRGDAVLELLGIAPIIEVCKSNEELKSDGGEIPKQIPIDRNVENNSRVVEFVSPDLENGLSPQDTLIELGCCCKNDLALVHYACALKWFVIHRSTICEICGHVAKNIRISDFNKVICYLKEYQSLRERTAYGNPGPSQIHSNTGVDLDAVASIRRQWLSEIALWFCPHNNSYNNNRNNNNRNNNNSNNNNRNNNNSNNNNNSIMETFSQAISEQPSNTVTEEAGLATNPTFKWAVEFIEQLLVFGVLTFAFAWCTAHPVGKKTTKRGVHIIFGLVCASTVVLLVRLFVITSVECGKAWIMLLFLWFVVFLLWVF